MELVHRTFVTAFTLLVAALLVTSAAAIVGARPDRTQEDVARSCATPHGSVTRAPLPAMRGPSC